MTHTGYTIQTVVKSMTIFFRDGKSLSGQIFVSEYSRLHAGHEKISEFFENEGPFFPFKTGDEIILFSKASIMFVEFEPDDDLSIYKKIPAQIVLTNGSTLPVIVPILVPNPAARLSDQVNTPEKFLQCLLAGSKNALIINKSNIVSIKESR